MTDQTTPKEEQSQIELIQPSEECSLYIKFSDKMRTEVKSCLKKYDPLAIADHNSFFVLTTSSPEEREAEKETLELLLKEKGCSISEFKKPFGYMRVEEAKRKVYVSDFDGETAEEDLSALFEQFGEIEEIILLKNREDKHYAFVKFVSEDSVEKALEKDVELNGKTLLVEKTRVNRPNFKIVNCPRYVRNSVLVTNFGAELTEELLVSTVNSIATPTETKFSSEYAILSFHHVSEALLTIRELNGKLLGGSALVAINAQNHWITDETSPSPRPRNMDARRRRFPRNRRRSFRQRTKQDDGEKETAAEPDKEEAELSER